MSTLQQTDELRLTYESYMAEGEVNRRYDILDGIRCFMTNPTRPRQSLLLRIARLLQDYEKASRSGQVQIAPCDILIQRFPLRTRQPDILLMSTERAARNPPDDDPAPLDPAPELVVEIVSPSDSLGVLAGKLADYQKVGVRECWIVQPHTRIVEVLALSESSIVSQGTFFASAVLSSQVFSELKIAVSEIFSETCS